MDLEPEIYCTSMTSRLAGLLARDTLKIAEHKGHNIPYNSEEIIEFERKARFKEYLDEFETSGYTACFYDAGHIPGSASVHLEKDGKTLLYTGDINTVTTELQNGADTAFPQSDILITESTYFGINHTPRDILEKKFIESIKETIDNGGVALVPAFSIGRTQEIMLLLKKNKLQAYVDGMGVDVFNLMKRSPESVRDIRKLENCFSSSSIVRREQRKDIIDEPGIIVTSAGMINGGPVLYYIGEIYDDPRSKIHLTGYQAEDTNGRRALESGYIENNDNTQHLLCGLELYDFSAHAGDSQLKAIVKKCCDRGTEKVFPVHGDNTEGFAAWIREEIGVDAIAPSNAETIYI
jgi:putative mRNA 3-end processing factor